MAKGLGFLRDSYRRELVAFQTWRSSVTSPRALTQNNKRTMFPIRSKRETYHGSRGCRGSYGARIDHLIPGHGRHLGAGACGGLTPVLMAGEMPAIPA